VRDDGDIHSTFRLHSAKQICPMDENGRSANRLAAVYDVSNVEERKGSSLQTTGRARIIKFKE